MLPIADPSRFPLPCLRNRHSSYFLLLTSYFSYFFLLTYFLPYFLPYSYLTYGTGPLTGQVPEGRKRDRSGDRSDIAKSGDFCACPYCQ